MEEQIPSEAGKKPPRRITDEDRAAAAGSVEQGEELFQTGDAVGAARQFLQAVERNPRSVQAWNDLGVALHAIGQKADAEVAFQTALLHDPENADAVANLEMAKNPPQVEEEGWPLATVAPVRLLAWPDYAQPGELESLMRRFAQPVSANPDVCLCLRHDPEVDGDPSSAVETLREIHDRIIGAESSLEVLLVDEPMAREDWPRLGSAVYGMLILASGRKQPRLSFGEAIQAPRIRSGADLEARLRAHGVWQEGGAAGG